MCKTVLSLALGFFFSFLMYHWDSFWVFMPIISLFPINLVVFIVWFLCWFLGTHIKAEMTVYPKQNSYCPLVYSPPLAIYVLIMLTLGILSLLCLKPYNGFYVTRCKVHVFFFSGLQSPVASKLPLITCFIPSLCSLCSSLAGLPGIFWTCQAHFCFGAICTAVPYDWSGHASAICPSHLPPSTFSQTPSC